MRFVFPFFFSAVSLVMIMIFFPSYEEIMRFSLLDVCTLLMMNVMEPESSVIRNGKMLQSSAQH